MFRIRCLQQEQVSVRVGVFTWIAALTGSCLQVTFEVGGEGGGGPRWGEFDLARA